MLNHDTITEIRQGVVKIFTKSKIEYKYPECFGIKKYLSTGYGINYQDCFECKFRSECKDKILSKKY